MIPLKSFIKLSHREKMLTIRALFWVMLIRIFLWGFPFAVVKKKVKKIASYLSSDSAPPISMSRLRLMIVIVSKYVPRATCLVQALAGHILFSKYGYTTSIKIGVLNENGEFEAHAWLEHEGGVVLGDSKKDYKTILDIKGGT